MIDVQAHAANFSDDKHIIGSKHVVIHNFVPRASISATVSVGFDPDKQTYYRGYRLEKKNASIDFTKTSN